MLKHGRAGVPMEVMGLMLGEFVDDYTVRVIDVFAMPQSGTVSFTKTFWLDNTSMSFSPIYLCDSLDELYFKSCEGGCAVTQVIRL